ncbi:uncharacterized protein LOC132740333 [Ruditapes philippinarum]|uniref:uncharacterized protein LOC132740333 n=1 Tax=Ruditapes philippinarum TaxID=129788 RepID=UPI00295AE141|nr:uncharacterized protein LOC132740333 [Ruditapes philippinarum]
MNPSCFKRLLIPDSMSLINCLTSVNLRTYCLKAGKLGYCGLTGLDAVVSYISAHMRKQGRIDTDLLVIDNPVSGEVVKQFKKAGVKKIACTIKEEEHFLKIKEQLTGSHHVYLYNLLGMHKQWAEKLPNVVESEVKLLASVGDVTGLVILASGISDVESLDVHRHLLKRVMTNNVDGFNSIKKIHWILALSEKSVTSKKHFQSNFSVIKLINSFYKHKNGINISLDESRSIFCENLDSKKFHKESSINVVRKKSKISSIKNSDVHFMHFVPKSSVLQKLRVEERIEFKTFVCTINGPQRLIPALEKLIPGCGLELIELGYGMADEVQKIRANKLLKLYKDVKSLPEFKGSALHALLTRKDAEIDLQDLQYDYNMSMVKW